MIKIQLFSTVVKPVVKKKNTSERKEAVAVCRKSSATGGVWPFLFKMIKKQKRIALTHLYFSRFSGLPILLQYLLAAFIPYVCSRSTCTVYLFHCKKQYIDRCIDKCVCVYV